MGSGKGRRLPHEGLNWRSYGLAFGDRVRTLRHIRELSQEQLADACGISRNSIQGIETQHHRGTPANPRLDTVYRLAMALDVPPGALIPDVDDLVTPEASASRADASADIEWQAQHVPFVYKAAGSLAIQSSDHEQDSATRTS